MSKFKIGDKVKVLGHTVDCYINWHPAMEDLIGKEYIVDKESYTDLMRLKNLEKWVFHQDWLELVKEKTMKKTKLVETGQIATTAEECFKALLEGKVLKYEEDNLRLLGGYVRNINKGKCNYYTFDGTMGWQVLEEKEIEWWEDIPESGLLCWVSNRNSTEKANIVTIGSKDNFGSYSYNSILSTHCFAYATPLTKEELQIFMDKL